ncbi:MAG: FecCD family ABC transporter permease [Elusimicrobiota bacterium]
MKRHLLFFSLFTAGAVIIALNLGSSGVTLFNMTGSNVILNLRIPRIIMGLVVGSGLSVAGVILQALLKNPLAEPYIVGTSSGAALGAAIVSFMGIAYFRAPAALAAGLITTFTVYSIAKKTGRPGPNTIILAGVIVGSFLSAVTLMFMVLDQKTAYDILFFLTGNLSFESTGRILFTSVLMLSGIGIAFFYGTRLDILSLEDTESVMLGVEVEKDRRNLFIVANIIVAVSVYASGIIGFVGLIVPHTVRLMTGTKHRKLILNSAVAGAGFLVLCDGLARSVIAPVELPVGVITAFTGGPFFLYLMVSKR